MLKPLKMSGTCYHNRKQQPVRKYHVKKIINHSGCKCDISAVKCWFSFSPTDSWLFLLELKPFIVIQIIPWKVLYGQWALCHRWTLCDDVQYNVKCVMSCVDSELCVWDELCVICTIQCDMCETLYGQCTLWQQWTLFHCALEV